MALAPNSFLSSFLPSLSLGQAIHLRQPQGHRCLSLGPQWPQGQTGPGLRVCPLSSIYWLVN